MADVITDQEPISAQPTKEFFVDMMIKDIPLEQAVLDLVDNCIDGAKRVQSGPEDRLDKYYVRITVGSGEFKILDNCGGFDIETARDYAFRFGRPRGKTITPNSIGQFGVGMKRALFKFGRHFIVRSATASEKWEVDVDVDKWELRDEWTFPWAAFDETSVVSEANSGTEILADRLRPEVAARFGTQQFVNSIIGLIKSKHRQFIALGLRITVNGHPISAISLYMLLTDTLRPGVDTLSFEEQNEQPVTAHIVVGLGDSSPREAGWYVVCNGRVVLEADRRPVTGWGLVEVEAERTFIPSFHNQFARFRGIVRFDSADSARVPWNTMKTDVDQESPIWLLTFKRMVEMMRPVLDFLNELDKDIDEFTRDASPLLNLVVKADRKSSQSLKVKTEFQAPRREDLIVLVKTTKIQYSRPLSDVEFLQEALGVSSAKAVGERTFDLALRKQKAE